MGAGYRRLVATVAAVAVLVPSFSAAASGSAQDDIFYVSPSGDDGNPGTAEAPWATLSRAFDSLDAGDTLFVKGGTYRERIITWNLNPGTAEDPVRVSAAPGERPVVQGLLWLDRPSYWIIDGLNVTWDATTGSSNEHMVKFSGGRNWRFTNAEVWGARSYAAILVAERADGWSLDHLHVHDTYRSNGRNQDDLISVTTRATGGTVADNVLENSLNGRAIFVGASSPGRRAPDRVSIHDNVMRNNLGPSNIQIANRAKNTRVFRNDMATPKRKRANVTQYKLHGRRNIVRNNVGRNVRRVVGMKALIDGGGNVVVQETPGDEDGSGDGGEVTDPGTDGNDGTDPGTGDVTDPDVSGLAAEADGSFAVRLEWAPPSGTSQVEVARDGKVVDRFPIEGPFSYTDRLRWESTTYRYKVTAFSASGNELASSSDQATTAEQSGAFPRLYSDGSFWNEPIGNDPAIDGKSDSYVAAAIQAYSSSANIANSDKWGISMTYADPVTRRYDIGCTIWNCDTDVSFRVPLSAKPTTGSDGHLAVVDTTNMMELDMYRAAFTGSTWTAGSRYVTEADGLGANCGGGQGCGGAVAAGFALFGGAIRPEEIKQGHIDHALSFTTPFTRSDVVACPATKTDGKFSDPAALPEGARIQLDPRFDVDGTSWPKWKKVVAEALQKYGAYLSDTSGSLAFRAETNLNRGYDAWSKVGVPQYASLSDLPWGRFRVLKVQTC